MILGSIVTPNQSRCPIQSWIPNKVHEFEYNGRLLTGLPDLAAQYSGIGIKATVKVYVKRPEVLVLEIKTPKYVDVNQVLHPKHNSYDTSDTINEWNWRNLNLPPLKEVNSYSYISTQAVSSTLRQ